MSCVTKKDISGNEIVKKLRFPTKMGLFVMPARDLECDRKRYLRSSTTSWKQGLITQEGKNCGYS